MTTDERQKLALWRMSVLGPLVSARLRHGDRQAYFKMAADRVHERPDGQLVRLSPRTIETWYRAYLRGGFGALMPSGRSDARTSRVLLPELVDLVLRTKREKPRRSVRQIVAILERAGRVEKGVPNRLTPRVDRGDFLALVEHAMTAAGARTKIFSDPALELLWRASRGLPRIASKLLRAALILAHERDQSFVDDDVMNAAIDDIAIDRPTTNPVTPSIPTTHRKPR